MYHDKERLALQMMRPLNLRTGVEGLAMTLAISGYKPTTIKTPIAAALTWSIESQPCPPGAASLVEATGYFCNSALIVLLPPGLRAESAACDRVAPTGGDSDAPCLASVVVMIADPPIGAGGGRWKEGGAGLRGNDAAGVVEAEGATGIGVDESASTLERRLVICPCDGVEVPSVLGGNETLAELRSSGILSEDTDGSSDGVLDSESEPEVGVDECGAVTESLVI